MLCLAFMSVKSVVLSVASVVTLNGFQYMVCLRKVKNCSLHTWPVWKLGVQKFWNIVMYEVLDYWSESISGHWKRCQLFGTRVLSCPIPPTFPLSEKSHGSHVHALTADSTSPLPVPVCLWDREYFWQWEGSEYIEGNRKEPSAEEAETL